MENNIELERFGGTNGTPGTPGTPFPQNSYMRNIYRKVTGKDVPDVPDVPSNTRIRYTARGGNFPALQGGIHPRLAGNGLESLHSTKIEARNFAAIAKRIPKACILENIISEIKQLHREFSTPKNRLWVPSEYPAPSINSTEKPPKRRHQYNVANVEKYPRLINYIGHTHA